MKLIDKVWLACAIDSEGTMGYYRRGFNQWGIPNVGISCAVGNSDRHYIEKCAHLMGTGAKERPPDKRITKKGKPYKPRYYAEVKCLKAYRVLKQILPFFIIKAERARELVALYDEGVIHSRAFPRQEPAQISFPEINKQTILPV